MAKVGQRLPQQDTVSTGHFGGCGEVAGLSRAQPGQIERVALWLAVAHEHDHVSQGYRMLARVVKGRDSWRGEVFGDRE